MNSELTLHRSLERDARNTCRELRFGEPPR